ncbi:MAG: hypothetical protein ABGW83_07850 [Flavobacteriaceae bacterium]
MGTSRAASDRYEELEIERDKLASESMLYINKILKIDNSNNFANELKKHLLKL